MNLDKRSVFTARDFVYWGLFIFVSVLVTNVVIGMISAATREATAFNETVAVNKKRQPVSAVIETSFGDITIAFNRKVAPVAVNNFVQLASSGFYDDTKFHRVVKGLLIQGGDPLSRESNRSLYGTGGPDYVFEDEIGSLPIARGAVVMANRGKPNTNGSQFFIVVADDAPAMDGKYTIFGTVVKGIEVVDAVSRVAVDEDEIPVDAVALRSVLVE